ncbi:MAG: glycosyltransferase family 4 protein, partial [Promethearchaeota archaeon]
SIFYFITMNKKLNLLILSPLSLENGRGGEISSMELAAGLNNYYNITLIDTNISLSKALLSNESILKKLKGVKRDNRIRFATLNLFNKVFTFPYPRDILMFYKKLRKSNILYTSNFSVKTNLILILFSLIHRNCKFIIGHRKPLHSNKLFSIYNLKIRISIFLFSLLKKRFYHHTISYHAKKFLENFIPPDKITHIIHGIELENFIKEDEEEQQEETLNFIYVGSLDAVHKGVDILLDGIEKTIEESRNLKIFFEFCGIGPLEKRLKNLEQKYPNSIRYNGYVDNSIIYKYFKRNDIFLLSSRREPFGRVLIEALAAKLIILCSKTFGSIEVLQNQDFAFFFHELSTSEIKDKILEVYNLWKSNPTKFNELKEFARRYAIQKYSVSQEIKLFKILIEKIASI